MRLEDLVPFVSMILIVGLIAGIGVLTMDKFSTAVKTDTTIANETVALTAGVGTTANNELVSLTSGAVLSNGTDINLAITNSDTGEITLSDPADYTGDVFTGYVYKADTSTSTTLDSARNAVGDISEDWMGLIVVVAILALVLGLVISGFAKFGNR